MIWITIPTLAFHLLCVNLATAGPLICMLYEWREGRGNMAAGRAGRSLAGASIIALLLGGATGLLLGWLRWSPEFQSALHQLNRKVMFGGIEIGFSLVLMIIHWLWWRSPESRGRIGRQIVLLLAGTNLLYHFPTLFAVLAHLQDVGPSEATISPSDFRQLLVMPRILAQSVHVAVACFAVAATYLIWRAERIDSPEDQATGRLAGGIALIATVLQAPIGIWLTVVYPKVAVQQLMGKNALATTAFVFSLLGALSLMHHLAVVMLRVECGRSRRISVVLTVAVVLMMTAVLCLTR